MQKVGQVENLSEQRASALSITIFWLCPALIGLLAIAQDLHWVGDFNACVKDIVFTVLLLQVGLHAGLGEGVKRFGVGVVLLGWAISVGLEPWIAPWMPDTWILSQREWFNGWPVAELLVLLIVSGAVWFGCKKKHLSRRDGSTYLMGMVFMLLSARLWFAHLDYQAENPESTWLPDEPYVSVPLIKGPVFEGKDWLVEHADYQETMGHIRSMLQAKQTQRYWWGGLKSSQEPHVFKATADGASVTLSYQAKPLEWQGKTSWTAMGVGSFILVFLEVFLLSRLMVVQGVVFLRSKTKSKEKRQQQL